MIPTPATEEWVQQWVLRLLASRPAAVALFPVGAVYVNVTNVDPATELGYGTWVAIGAGRALVGYAAGDPDFGTVEGTAGATSAAPTGSTDTVSAHSHTYTDVPDHTHRVNIYKTGIAAAGTAAAQGVDAAPDATLVSGSASGGVATGTTATSGSHSHTAGTLAVKVVQPSIVVCFWKRTA